MSKVELFSGLFSNFLEVNKDVEAIIISDADGLIIDGEKRSASAVAEQDCRLAVIFKPDLDEYIEKYPKNGIKILQGISEIAALRLRTMNEEYFSLHNELLKREVQNETGN